jgi:hypothetical protein
MYCGNSGLSVTSKVRLKVNFSYEIHCVCVCVERERFGCMNSGLGKCGIGMKFAMCFTFFTVAEVRIC